MHGTIRNVHAQDPPRLWAGAMGNAIAGIAHSGSSLASFVPSLDKNTPTSQSQAREPFFRRHL